MICVRTVCVGSLVSIHCHFLSPFNIKSCVHPKMVGKEVGVVVN